MCLSCGLSDSLKWMGWPHTLKGYKGYAEAYNSTWEKVTIHEQVNGISPQAPLSWGNIVSGCVGLHIHLLDFLVSGWDRVLVGNERPYWRLSIRDRWDVSRGPMNTIYHFLHFNMVITILIFYLIGSGNPSCLSIKCAWNTTLLNAGGMVWGHV